MGVVWGLFGGCLGVNGGCLEVVWGLFGGCLGVVWVGLMGVVLGG